MARKRWPDRREDLRRLPLAAQIARVRKYHGRKMKSAWKAAGCDDPWVDADNIKKRFKTVCPEGLLRAYLRQEIRNGTSRVGLILVDE